MASPPLWTFPNKKPKTMIPAVVFLAARRRSHSHNFRGNNPSTNRTATGLYPRNRNAFSSSFSWLWLLLLLSLPFFVTLHVSQLQEAFVAVAGTWDDKDSSSAPYYYYYGYYPPQLNNQYHHSPPRRRASTGSASHSRMDALLQAQEPIDRDGTTTAPPKVDVVSAPANRTTAATNHTTSDTNPSLWKNDYHVVHVINTRFMQYQPTLRHLAQARWELFQTITLPSLRAQTTQQFLWIVRIDPQLDQDFQEKFLDVMQEMPNLVVLLSNDNPVDFRQQGQLLRAQPHTTHPDNLLVGQSGSAEQGGEPAHQYRRQQQLLQDYYTAAQSHVVLETRLDADDALAYNVLEQIQRQAHSIWGGTTTGISTTHSTLRDDGYRVWCLGQHVEWQYQAWGVPPESNKNRGTLITPPSANSHRRFCITAGLTFGYQVNATAEHNVPTHKHHQLHKMIPPCWDNPQDHHNQDTRTLPPRRENCLAMVYRHDQKPLALRARTLTSAGMMNVMLEQPNVDHSTDKVAAWNGLQAQVWETAQQLFGTDVNQIVQLRKNLRANEAAIAADNAAGQCTPGHSCKTSSRQILARLQSNGGGGGPTAKRESNHTVG